MYYFISNIYNFLKKIRLRWHREIGLLDRNYRQWIPRRPICEPGGRGFVSVGLKEIRPAIILFLIMIGVSIFLLLCEIILKRVLQFYSTPPKVAKKKIFLK